MMKDKHSDDILSAYFDGEATPAEQAEVDRLRASAPEVRRQLKDFQTISQLLGDLPRECVPAEFSAEVMQQAERKMLLPDAPAPAAPSHRRLRSRMMILGGVATAAGLLLMVLTFEARRPAPQREVAQSDHSAAPRAAPAATPAAAPAPVPASSVETAAANLARKDRPDAPYAASRLHSEESRTAESERIALRISKAKAPGTDVASRGPSEPLKDAELAAASRPQTVPGMSPDAAKKLQIASATPAAAAAGSPAAKFENELAKSNGRLVPARGANLNDLKAGQILDAIEVSGDRISVVKVTVIDVDKGLQAVQVVLEQNSIHEQLPAANRGAEPAAAAPAALASGEMRGLFVDAPSEQISATVHELMKQSNVVDIEMDQPIEISQLGDAERNLVSQKSTPPAEPTAAGLGGSKTQADKRASDEGFVAGKSAPDARKADAPAQNREGKENLAAANSQRKERDSTALAEASQLQRKAGVSREETLAFSNAYQRMNLPAGALQKVPAVDRGEGAAKDAVAKKPTAPQASPPHRLAESQEKKASQQQKTRALAKGSVKLIFVIEPQAVKSKPAAPRKAGVAGGAA